MKTLRRVKGKVMAGDSAETIRAPSAPPASEGWFRLSAIGVGLAVLWLLACTFLHVGVFICALGAIAIYATPQLWRAIRDARGVIGKHWGLYVDQTIVAKFVAVFFVLTLFYLAMMHLDAYQLIRFEPTRVALSIFYPVLVIAAFPYICLVNSIQRETGSENDEYKQVGDLLLFRFDNIDFGKLRHFAMSWAVKLFFFPLMFWELFKAVDMTYGGFGRFQGGFFDYFLLSTAIIYFIDVALAASGYLFTLRLFGWQVRSCQPFALGWLFTLMCYYPFITWVYPILFDYKSGFTWDLWLADAGPLLVVWAGAIIALKITWIIAITTFGLRFSNLTNRGIITDGVYRFTKHPSYVSKNLFWWLIYIPFIPVTSVKEAIFNCAALLGVNLIYFIRARFEERHLSEEPRYVAYALWMEEHGLFRSVSRLLPMLKYRPPSTSDARHPAGASGAATASAQ